MRDVTLKCITGTLPMPDARAVAELQAECFGDVAASSIEEDFTAQEFARILAYDGLQLVGTLALFKRHVDFDREAVLLGGIGGVCVRTGFRRQGIATRMLESGLESLRRERCDIACLNVDLDKKLYGIYEKTGFVMMDRPISFENAKGELVQDTGTMFAPICSRAVFERVMNSQSTFHYGRGYW